MIKKFFNETNQRKLVINTVISLVSIINILNHQVNSSQNSYIGSFYLSVSASGQERVSDAGNFFQNLWSRYFHLIGVVEENEKLKSYLNDLEQEQVKLREAEKENKRLKLLLDIFKESPEQDKILARVISWDSSERFRILRIDKGKKDSLSVNDIVQSSDGLVGKIIRVSDDYAEVLTLLDELMRIDVLNLKSREFGVTKGTGDLGLIELNYIGQDSEVSIGDYLLTSGLSELYPKGIKVGEIKSVVKEPGNLNLKIGVMPATRFSQLEEVFIIKEKSQ